MIQVYSSSGTREDWQTARAERAGFHNGGEGKDGQQAVQLTHGHVQRGHHRGDHDTGSFGLQFMDYVKSQNQRQLGRCDIEIGNQYQTLI